MTQTDATARAALTELGRLFVDCHKTFLDLAAAQHWQPQPGSPAALEAPRLAAMDPGPSPVNPLAGLNLVIEASVTYLEIAAGHLRGLGAVFVMQEVTFAPPPLIRAVMEASGRAVLVIGRSSDTPADRLARAYLEEFYSAEAAKRSAGRLAGKQHPGHAQMEADHRALRRHIVAVFPGTTNAELGEHPKRLAGQVQASPEGAVRSLFDLIHAAGGGTVTGVQSAGMYDYLSSGTHPTLYTAREHRLPVDQGDHLHFDLPIDLDYLRRAATAAVVAFYGALSYTSSYLGLRRNHVDALTAKIDVVLPGTFNS